MDRIATFKSFIARAPKDPFPRYGLAMEYKSRGDLGAAWAAFSDLLDQFPDYVPTYLMAGGTLAGLGRREQAIEVYRRGIEVATRKGDPHARGELETAANELASGPDQPEST
jgi:tetratricopeptide (TPR) repeat protein